MKEHGSEMRSSSGAGGPKGVVKVGTQLLYIGLFCGMSHDTAGYFSYSTASVPPMFGELARTVYIRFGETHTGFGLAQVLHLLVAVILTFFSITCKQLPFGVSKSTGVQLTEYRRFNIYPRPSSSKLRLDEDINDCGSRDDSG